MGKKASQRLLRSLLEQAGIDAAVASTEMLGIGSAGLNMRGDRDEDGTHARVTLGDGTRLIFREYANTTGMVDVYQAKELAVYRTLGEAGLPTPDVLASRSGTGRTDGDPPATLVVDAGGDPLETVFRSASGSDRSSLWATVGGLLRRVHEIDVERAPFLRLPIYQRPWTRFLPYFAKSLKPVKATRPDLGEAVDALLALRRPLQRYLDSRPRTICVGGAGGYLPGMLLSRDGSAWTCASWLNLGYYVSIRDPATDVMLIAVSHREWTGDDLPSAFYDAYGSRPDELCETLYGAAMQLGRGAAYLRGTRRKGAAPPPHSTAVEALDQLPATVDRLASLVL